MLENSANAQAIVLAARDAFANLEIVLVLLVFAALALGATKLISFELHQPQGLGCRRFGGYLRKKVFG